MSLGKTVVRTLSIALSLALALITLACSATVTPVKSRPFIGIYEPYSPGTYNQLDQFTGLTGIKPRVVSYYSPWGTAFQTGFAEDAKAHHSEVLVQIQPTNISLATIAGGGYDAFLHQYATQVKRFKSPVILSFGQEMNGNWYSWGAGHESPADFIAAWRHIVTVFRNEGVTNVTWLWDPNCNFGGSNPVQDWWPGQSYVNWVGIDCYYAYPTDTFTKLFGGTIGNIRQFTNLPLLIAETATGPNNPKAISQLFAGASLEDIIGIVWFDQAQTGDPLHQDWRLEDSPPNLAALVAAEKKYG